VHPGEVPSSYVMNGLLKFLLDKNDLAAEIARDNFVWVLVPIINTDGVYRGIEGLGGRRRKERYII